MSMGFLRSERKNGHLPISIGANTSISSEHTPLLQEIPVSDVPSRTIQLNIWDKESILELWSLFRDAAPVIVGYMLQMSLQTVTVIISGRRSPLDLSVAAFSLMFALVTGWMIALGGTTALDTLASATFTGSQNKQHLGVLLQRALFVLTLLYIPVAVSWANSKYIFLALGQDPELSHYSSRFLTYLIPGGLGYIFFETMKKYLQAQGELSRNSIS